MKANQRGMLRRCTDALRRCGRSARYLPVALPRFARLPAAERRTTLKVLAVLLVVEAVIRFTRLPRLSRALGVEFAAPPGGQPAGEAGGAGAFGPTLTSKGPADEADLPEDVARARRCVDRIMPLWPLGAGPCLRESLVLGHLIRDRRPVLRLGVARHGHRIRAHAWIELDGQPVNDPEGFVAFGGSAD